MNNEKLLKSNFYQIIIPVDTTIEKIIDTENYSIKDFQGMVFLVEKIDKKVLIKKEV